MAETGYKKKSPKKEQHGEKLTSLQEIWKHTTHKEIQGIELN